MRVIGLVLAAAVMHAGWNAMLKGGGDRLRSVSLMAATTGLLGAAMAAALPAPKPECWTFLGLSAAMHVGYNLLLVLSYREGDLGVAYPIARGSSPMLVTLGAAVTAGERLGGATLLGIGLISAGILGLAWERGRGVSNRGLGPALATGAVIAGYTIVDGLGARRSGDPRSYAAWLFLLFGPPMVPILAARRGWPATFCPRRDGPRRDGRRRVDARLRDRDLGGVDRADGGGLSPPRDECRLRGPVRVDVPGRVVGPATTRVMPGRRGGGGVARISALKPSPSDS